MLLKDAGIGANYEQAIDDGKPSGLIFLGMLVPVVSGDSVGFLRDLRGRMQKFLVSTTVIEANNPPEEEEA